MTVGTRFGDELRRDVASGAWSIIDDHWTRPRLVQLLRDQSRCQIRATARGKSDHDPDGFPRKILCKRGVNYRTGDRKQADPSIHALISSSSDGFPG
jgi:hypothetical protein